jgi:hypothetical protein
MDDAGVRKRSNFRIVSRISSRRRDNIKEYYRTRILGGKQKPETRAIIRGDKGRWSHHETRKGRSQLSWTNQKQAKPTYK